MARPIEIPISTPYNGRGAQEAAKAIKAVQQAEVQAAQGAAKLAQAQSQVASAAAKASTAQNQAAISAQKLAQAENATAVSAQKVTQASANAAAATARMEAAQSRAAAAAQRLQQSTDRTVSSAGRGASALQGLASAAGAVGIGLGAAQLVQGTVELTKMGAQAGVVEARFNGLAEAAGTTGSALLAALRQASGGEISDLNLQLAANRANLLGVAKSAEELGVLMAIARDRAQQLGTSATDAFNDLVTGLGRGSPLILDNLGIMVSVKEANEAYAASVGKTAAALTEAEQKQALINAVIAQGNQTLAESGGAQETAQGNLDKLAAAWENTGARIGKAIADAYDPTTDVKVLQFIASLFPDEATRQAQAQAATIGEAVRTIAAEYSQLKSAGADGADALGALVPRLQAVAAASTDNAQTIQALVTGYAHGTVTIGELRTALENLESAQVTNAARSAEQARINYIVSGSAYGAADATDAAAAAAEQHSAALAQDAAESLLTAANAQELALAKADLEQQARAAAFALYASGDAGAAAAAQLANSSSQVDQLTAAYYRLLVAQGAAGSTNRGSHGASKGPDELRLLGVGGVPPPKKTRGGGGGRGAGSAGGAAKVSEAQQTADKIVQIEQDAAEKLMEIDRRAAEARAQAYRDLANDIAATSADMVASQEANDLELVGASDERIQELAAREQAEAKARIAAADAASEAQRRSAEGDAETARKIYDERSKQIEQQQSLDEEYYRRQAELAGDDAATAELKTQYDEATKAIEDATNVRIQLAEQEAQQKQEAALAEKQAVLDSAAAQVEALGGTKQAADVALQSVQDLNTGLTSLPKTVETRVIVTYETKGTPPKETSGTSSGSSSSSSEPPTKKTGSGAKLAGGGTLTGVTSGPMQVTLGDNPGGVEAYSISAVPISGTGRSTASAGQLHLAGGTQADVDAAAAAARARLGGGTIPALPVAGGGKSSGGGGGGSASTPASSDEQLKAIEQAIQTLEAIANLESLLAGMDRGALDLALVNRLADDAFAVAQAVGKLYLAFSEEQADSFGRFTGMLQDAAATLQSFVEFRRELVDIGPPIDMATVQQLAQEAFDAAHTLGNYFVQFSQAQRDSFGRFTEMIQDAIGTLSDAANLRKELVDIGPPIDQATLSTLGFEAQQAQRYLVQYLVPTSEAQADELGRFADTSRAAIGVLRDIAGLRNDLRDPAPPIDPAMIERLATDAARAEAAMRSRLVPTSEAQAEAAGLYADAVQSSTSALSAALDLSGRQFADYIPPSDAQLQRIVKDSSRVVTAVRSAATLMGADGLTGAQAWADAVGATYSAIEQGLIVFDKIRFSDISVDPSRLASFVQSTSSVLTAMNGLASQARSVDRGGLAAISAVATATDDIVGMLTGVQAAPVLPVFAGSAGGAGGGTVNVNIYNPPANLDIAALTRQVETAVSRSMGARR